MKSRRFKKFPLTTQRDKSSHAENQLARRTLQILASGFLKDAAAGMKMPGETSDLLLEKNGVENSPVWWFYKGFLKKRGTEGWFFVVKNVVKGVIKLEDDGVLRGEVKYATDFRFILGRRLDL